VNTSVVLRQTTDSAPRYGRPAVTSGKNPDAVQVPGQDPEIMAHSTARPPQPASCAPRALAAIRTEALSKCYGETLALDALDLLAALALFRRRDLVDQ
jgi:hypothetical protein